MIKRAHIRQFLAVVDEGSFTQAATRLRLTQPTLSTGVAELERLVGTALFLRKRRQLRLTEAGGRFLPIARELDRGFRAADAFGSAAQKDWPDLRLGVIRSVAGPMLQMLVSALSSELSVELIEGSDAELRAAVSSGRAHLALTLLRDGEKGAHILPLLSEPYRMMVATTHRLAGRTLVEPDELVTEIMIARRSCEFLDGTSRFFSEHGVRPRFALRSESDERCMRMVVAGLGMTTAPLSLAIEGVCCLPVKNYDFSRRLGFVGEANWMTQDRMAQRIAMLIGEVRATLPKWSHAS